MNLFFANCQDAIKSCSESKTYGCFFSSDPKTNLNMHLHECCELFFALSEGTCFLIDDAVYDIHPGDLFFVNQFEAHKVSAVGKKEFYRYVMQIDPSFITSNSTANTPLVDCFYQENRQHKISLSSEEQDELVALFNSIREDNGYGDDVYKKMIGINILIAINKYCNSRMDNNVSSILPKELQCAIAYINNHFTENVTLKSISENCYVSTSQLCRLFASYCSTTVLKYLTSKRITHAKKMLRQGKSVTETAFASGFNDYSNFIRTFKNAVGVSPGKYKSDNIQ